MNKNFTYFPHHPFRLETKVRLMWVVAVKFPPMEKQLCFYLTFMYMVRNKQILHPTRGGFRLCPPFTEQSQVR